MIAGVGAVLGSLAAGSRILAQNQASMPAQPGTGANDARTALHQEVSLPASPQRIYEALLDSKQFTLFSGAPAEIEPKAGGVFSMFGGLIVGRNIELVQNERIVQAWRPTHWKAGIYSIVRFELQPQASETMVGLDHTGFPEGECDSLARGWKTHYWERLKKFFS